LFLISFSRATIATATTTISAAAAAIATTSSTISTATTTGPAATAATITTPTATAIAAAAITTSAATIAAATPVTAAPVGFIGFLYRHFLSADRRIVKRFNGSPGFRFIGHIYEPEPFALTSLPIHNHLRKIHCSIQFEHFFQVHIVEITGKTCYKKLHAKDLKR
jgi:hypothetical protein